MKSKVTLWATLGLVLLAFHVTAASRALREQDELAIAVSPAVVSMASQGVWVSVHTNLKLSAVNTVDVELNDIPVVFCKADALGYLVAKFNLDDVKDIIAPPSATLVLSGTLKTGDAFSASDVIGVVD